MASTSTSVPARTRRRLASGGEAGDFLRRHPDDQPEDVPRLARRALPGVLLPERAEQRLVPVLDQFGRAADVHGLVWVLGVEDREADPWVPGEIPGLLAPESFRGVTLSLASCPGGAVVPDTG